MDWSNECVLEFIELLQGEPCIWNPKNKNHKNRNLVNDAWVRVKNSFSVPCSIEELKKKRNTLLTQYRDCLKKIKDSTKTGIGSEEVYKPSWFAFDAIHSYMGAVYDYRPTLCTEIKESEQREERSQSLENYSEESNTESPLSHTSNTERPLSRESNSRSGSDSFSISKRKRGMQELLIAKKQMDEAFTIIKNRSNRTEKEKQLSECDLYGQLLSEKLKHLDEDNRLGLMNEIDILFIYIMIKDLVFKYIMNVKKLNRSTTSYLLSTQGTVNNQPVVCGPSSLLTQSPVTSQGYLHNSQSLLNYEPMESTESQLLPQPNALNNYSVQISIPEGYPSPDSAVENYAAYSLNNNVLFNPNIPSTSKKLNMKPKVTNAKKIKVLSETVISPPEKRNIIEEAYVKCSDDDDSLTQY